MKDFDKVVLMKRNPDQPGGAENSLDNLAEEFDIETEIISPKKASRKDLLPHETSISLDYLKNLFLDIETNSEDKTLYIYQHETALKGSLTSFLDKNSVSGYIIPDIEKLHDKRFRGSNTATKTINFLNSFINSLIEKFVIKKSDLVLANSNFTKKKYQEKFREAEIDVVYPFVPKPKSSGLNHKGGEYILHVNPQEHKGINKTLAIAEDLPEHNFVVIGKNPSKKTKEKMERLDNLNYRGYVDNIKKLYKNCKIVLMPVKWHEPYGMVPVEAGFYATPTIAADKGGLLDSIGCEDLIVEAESTKKYTEKIKEVDRDYSKYCSIALDNSLEKSSEKQFQKLKSLLENLD